MRITQQTIDKFAKAADDAINFRKQVKGIPGIIMEFSDGRLYKFSLEWLNESYSDKIPDRGIAAIETILNAFADKDYQAITDELVEIARETIDIPYLDEEAEGDIIGGLLHGVVRAIERSRMAAIEPGQGPPDKDPD